MKRKLTCTYCGKEFYRDVYQENTVNFFCSQACHGLFQRTPKQKLTCAFCGKVFYKHVPRERANTVHFFCSNTCQGRFQESEALKTKLMTEEEFKTLCSMSVQEKSMRTAIRSGYNRSYWLRTQFRLEEIRQELLITTWKVGKQALSYVPDMAHVCAFLCNCYKRTLIGLASKNRVDSLEYAPLADDDKDLVSQTGPLDIRYAMLIHEIRRRKKESKMWTYFFEHFLDGDSLVEISERYNVSVHGITCAIHKVRKYLLTKYKV